MNQTIIQIEKVPLTPEQKKHLSSLFTSEGFSILSQLLVAKCIQAQVPTLEAQIYSDVNTAAKDNFENGVRVAREINAALDLLDELSKKEDEWHLVTIKPSR